MSVESALLRARARFTLKKIPFPSFPLCQEVNVHDQELDFDINESVKGQLVNGYQAKKFYVINPVILRSIQIHGYINP